MVTTSSSSGPGCVTVMLKSSLYMSASGRSNFSVLSPASGAPSSPRTLMATSRYLLPLVSGTVQTPSLKVPAIRLPFTVTSTPEMVTSPSGVITTLSLS